MTHKHDKSSMLSQGVFIFVYLAVLTLLEFGIAITFMSATLLVVIALVKAVLVVYYYMHIYQLNAEDHNHDENSYEYKTATNRIGLWLFLISDSFVFGGLLVMRINLLGLTHPDLNQNLGLFVTAILLVSSFFMNRGEIQMKNRVSAVIRFPQCSGRTGCSRRSGKLCTVLSASPSCSALWGRCWAAYGRPPIMPSVT